jgi:thiol-disulfide isomerase/thioredoxin
MTAIARPNLRVPLLAGGIVALLAVVAVVVTAIGGDDGGGGSSSIEETRAVTVEGGVLPTFDGAAADPAVGLRPPNAFGQSFDGTPVIVGEPSQLVIFLAHWCPHCQREVPVITDWLAADGAPDGLSIVAVSTSVTPGAPNYPPSAWLQDEGWPVATLADDDASSVAVAFGVGSYPSFVAIGADGTVLARGSGELTVPQLEALVAATGGTR